MMYSPDQILDDLSAFADLGTEAPTLVRHNGMSVVRLVRESEPMELAFSVDGTILERYQGAERRHSNLRAFLASPSLANLGKWADSQRLQLHPRVEKETIPILGQLDETEGDIVYFDNILTESSSGPAPRVSVTLVNGPAGIGKTSLIRSLAYRRARNFRREQRPLILHVESRGRVLQNLMDLMAFSLQTLRLGVTYDQIPALVRNGLVVLAIDGFDELGDPNGYDLAWAQLNDLIVSSRAQGNIILAGRETFISKDRMEFALTAIDQAMDKLQIFTICALRPTTARAWLQTNGGWSDNLLDSEAVTPLFEEGSYALRPFFLSELARGGVATQIQAGRIDDLLSFLIDAMLDREAKKFGRDIEATTTEDQRKTFVRRLMEEVARDLAENQSDAIPGETLTWLAEIVASDIVQPNLIGILKNRAGVIAFLSDDDRRGYRRFMHEQVLNFFLSKVTIRAISENETPKYIRRNILGLDFLENFSSVFRHLSPAAADAFFSAATRQLGSLSDSDRARRNLGSLVLAGCGVAEPTDNPLILEGISLDDVFLTESLSPVILRAVTIAQLYAREADLRSLRFSADCYIASLVADEGTIPSDTLPLPTFISLPDKSLTDPEEKRRWLKARLQANLTPISTMDQSRKLEWALNRLELFNLLGRVARYKQFWIKDTDEKATRRILDDPNWEVLKKLMLEHDLLVERHDVPASGRPGVFYHVKDRKSLLISSEREPPEHVRAFVVDVLRANLEIIGIPLK